MYYLYMHDNITIL